MRPVQPYDLQDAARALMAADPSERGHLARMILDRADLADRYRKRFQRPHPQFGGGTLSAAACSFPRANMPWRCNETYLRCMRILLTAWVAHQDHRDL